MKLTNLKTIFIKEFSSFLNSATAYIVLTVFLVLWEFLFFRTVFLIGESSLRSLMTYLPWLCILFIPALTMGSLSEEKQSGTLEILLTHPISILELILGKFAAILAFVSIGLFAIFPLAYGLNHFGSLDWGVVISQFTASILLVSVLISLGLFVSSLFTSQISSLLVTSTISFLFVIAGFEFVTLSLPIPVARVLESLSILTHFDSMSRGVLDLRDIFFFFSAIAIFVALTSLQLLKLRIGNQQQTFRQFQFLTLLFVGIALTTNLVGYRIPGRIDLTQNQIYTLSDATVETITNLPDVVNIQLFATSELPSQLRPILTDIRDLLHDYQTVSSGRITVDISDPNQDETAKSRAAAVGVQEVQFNVVNQDQLQLKRGYLGLAVLYGDQSETIPLISDTSDLEYQLTSFIKKLTSDTKPSVAFLSGHGEKSLQQDFTLLNQELQKTFTLTELNLDSAPIDPNISTIVVAGPTDPIDATGRQQLDEFIKTGKSALFLLDAVSVNETNLAASINTNSLADFIPRYGTSLNVDLVTDLRSHETVNFGGNGVTYLARYPLWPRLQAVPDSPINSRISSVLIPWASSISLDSDTLTQDGWQAQPILTTTEAGGIVSGPFNLRPDQEFATTDLSTRTVAVALTSSIPENNSRIIVVGDSAFLTDGFVSSSRENLAFGLNAISWLAQEDSLAGIQLKQRLAQPLLFQNETQKQLLKYANLALISVGPIAFGAFRLFRRRSLSKFTYSS